MEPIEEYLDPDVRWQRFVEDARQQSFFGKSGVSYKPYKFKLTIAPDIIILTRKISPPWVRFWQKFLLGWQWEKLEER